MVTVAVSCVGIVSVECLVADAGEDDVVVGRRVEVEGMLVVFGGSAEVAGSDVL